MGWEVVVMALAVVVVLVMALVMVVVVVTLVAVVVVALVTVGSTQWREPKQQMLQPAAVRGQESSLWSGTS